MTERRERTNRVVLDNNALLRMANDSRFTLAFPALLALQPVKRGCKTCEADAAKFNEVRVALVQMGQVNKRKLREMLNTRQVKIPYVDEHRRVVNYMF